MKNKIIALSVVSWLAIFQVAIGQNSFADIIKRVVPAEYSKYTFISPQNNFGICTCYKGKRFKITKDDFLVGTYKFFGIDSIPTDTMKWMRPNEMIEQDCEPIFVDSVNIDKQTMFTAMLPIVESIVGIGAKVDRSIKQTAKIENMRICRRFVEYKPLNDYIKTLNPDKFGILEYYNEDKLVIIISDIVVESLTIKVTAEKEVQDSFSVKLLGSLTKFFGDSTKFGVQLKNDLGNVYSMTITTPQIIGILPARKSGSRAVLTDTPFNSLLTTYGWESSDVSVDFPDISKVYQK